ncbi:GntR family transcriptional regulator [Cohnella thailandensis]
MRPTCSACRPPCHSLQDHKPINQQLHERLREQIRTGRLKGGTRLPSVRALSTALNSERFPLSSILR